MKKNIQILGKQLKQFDEKEYIRILKHLVKISPRGFFTILKAREFIPLMRFIQERTSFIDYNVSIATRVWYVLSGYSELIECSHPNCHKKVRRQFSPVKDIGRKFWCCTECFNDDPRTKENIGKLNSKNNKHKKQKRKLPPECEIIYHQDEILYDDVMNEKLREFYDLHKKTFKFWITKEPKLYEYLLEKSYPLIFTKLNLETRVFWVLNRMQKIPRCPTCGRQLDFENVSRRKGWKKFCDGVCANNADINIKKLHETNSRNFWKKHIVSSPLVEPLFDFEEFNKFKHDKEHLYKCRCKKCGKVFYARLDMNFFRREANDQACFRCQKCFPLLNSHSSKGEKQLLAFIKTQFPELLIKKDRKQIKPYEIDIWIPEKKIGIEYNGTYWHSIDHSKGNKNTQLKKTKLCEKAGIKLIHIWEDEWLFQQDQTKEFLKQFIDSPEDCLMGSIDRSKDKIEVDRQRFNKCVSINGYSLVGQSLPKPSERGNINMATNITYDCGQLIYKKLKN